MQTISTNMKFCIITMIVMSMKTNNLLVYNIILNIYQPVILRSNLLKDQVGKFALQN